MGSLTAKSAFHQEVSGGAESQKFFHRKIIKM